MILRSHRPRVATLAVTAMLALAGCSSASSAGASTAPGPASADDAPGSAAVTPPVTASSPTSTALLITVTVNGSKVTPAPSDIPVAKGQAIKLTVISVSANELHVHGPDLSKPLPAGTPVSVDLTFTDAGAYEVETHEPPLRLLRFVVR
jgi:hypothetical protein